MFLNSSLPSYAVVIMVAVVILQYALALFCLLKLAYLDIPKKQYVLWNLLILLVFFIGAAVFLVYYYKAKGLKLIVIDDETQVPQTQSEQTEAAGDVVSDETPKASEEPEKTEQNENVGDAFENADGKTSAADDAAKDE